jgi:hypothetical protein
LVEGFSALGLVAGHISDSESFPKIVVSGFPGSGTFPKIAASHVPGSEPFPKIAVGGIPGSGFLSKIVVSSAAGSGAFPKDLVSGSPGSGAFPENVAGIAPDSEPLPKIVVSGGLLVDGIVRVQGRSAKAGFLVSGANSSDAVQDSGGRAMRILTGRVPGSSPLRRMAKMTG